MSGTGMWKQLFAEPPPDAMQNLLTPRRKFVYGMIAFAPGTLLALYLSSVKRQMNEENEKLRLQHVSAEIAGAAAHEQKDIVLMQMIEELRERIQELEREARGDTIAHKSSEVHKSKDPLEQKPKAVAPAPIVQETPTRRELPSFLMEYEDTLRPWLDRVDMLKAELEKLRAQLTPVPTPKDTESERIGAAPERRGITGSGIRERVAEREREMRARDVREHAQKASSQSSTNP